MSVYKIHVEDRNYNSWKLYETVHFKLVELTLDPIENKLFSNDFFTFDKNKVEIIHSSIRTGSFIPGVLILHGSKTYGRKNGKLLYKCIPDDKRLPPFLVPYEMKQVGFSKVFVNLYVTFHFIEWDDKHPYGQLDQVIGPVDILTHFYEYQLYCKSLHASIQKFQKDTSKALHLCTFKTPTNWALMSGKDNSYHALEMCEGVKNKPHDTFIESIRTKYPKIEDRTDPKQWFIFSIDPEKSTDFDDAFSIRTLDSGVEQLSIYISNVTIWMDVLNLWDSFSKRISTIYLPDQKRPMLPTILSDCLCSLQSKNTRIALVLDVWIKNGEIVKTDYSNCTVRLAKNFVYEEAQLLGNDHYQNLFQVTKDLSKKYKYISHVRDSHDVVSYLMILMNYHCAKEMIGFKNGIFRANILKRDIEIPESLPEEVGKFIKIMKSSSGQYIDGAEVGVNLNHAFLELDAYIHITSPIRRLVDLLNILQFQENMGIISLSGQSKIFYHKWLQDLDYINTTMRSIRKVQVDCSLLDICTNSPETLEKEYDGYLFDKLERQDGLYQYSVFLPTLKLSSRITLRENFINNYENKKFKLFLFNDEENFKKKIRLQLLPLLEKVEQKSSR